MEQNFNRAEQMQAGQDSAGAYQQMFRSMPTSAASVLGPMISSPNPEVRQQARDMLVEYKNRSSPASIAAANYADEKALQLQQEMLINRGNFENQQKLFPLEMLKAQREIDLAVMRTRQANTSEENKQFQIENAVRSQYQRLPAIQQALMTQRHYQTGYRNLDLQSNVGMAMALTDMVKQVEPESVTTQGEVDRVNGNNSYVQNLVQELTKQQEEGLTAELRTKWKDVMDGYYQASMMSAYMVKNSYTGLERKYRIKPGDVTNSTGINWGLTPDAMRKRLLIKYGNPGKPPPRRVPLSDLVAPKPSN